MAIKGATRGGDAADTGHAKGDGVIDPFNAYIGARLAQASARDLLEDAVALYGEGRHNGATVLAILSAEESLKGMVLSRYFRKRMPVTEVVWESLKDHDNKLTHVYDWVLEQMRSEKSAEFFKKQERDHGKLHINGIHVTPDVLMPIMEKNKTLHRRMRPAKEACMYQDWDRQNKKWATLSPHESESLSHYVVEAAHADFEMFLSSLDFAMETFIRENPKLESLKEPHPAVPEIPRNVGLLADGEKTLQKFPIGDQGERPAHGNDLPEEGDCDAMAQPDLIDHAQACAGVDLIQKKAKRLYDDAASLYGRGRHRSAIVLSILSVEESLKGAYVASRAQKNLGLKERHWNQLEKHGYKLNRIDILGEMLGTGDVQELYRERILHRAIPAFGGRNPTTADIKSFRSRMGGLVSGLDFVKKRLLYYEWIPQYGKWDGLGYLDGAVQDDLAFCVLDMAKWQYAAFGLVARSPEAGGGIARRGGSAAWPGLDGEHDEPHKLLSGETVLAAILQEGLVAMCPQAVTRNLAKKCMEIIGYTYHDSANWHPVVKTYFAAFGSLLRSPDGEYVVMADNESCGVPQPEQSHKTDGEYVVMADNERQTYGGRPTLGAIAKMRKDGLVGECAGINVNGTWYRAHDSRIAALLDAELALARWHGAEVSIERLSEAFGAIGVGVYALRDEDVERAIRDVQAGVSAGALPLPSGVAADVRAATVGEWEGLNPSARAYIAAAYKKKANALVISRRVGRMRKSMIRDMVWHALTGWGAPRIGDAGERLRRLRAAALCYYADAWPCMGGHGFWPFWRPQCGVACTAPPAPTPPRRRRQGSGQARSAGRLPRHAGRQGPRRPGN